MDRLSGDVPSAARRGARRPSRRYKQIAWTPEIGLTRPYQLSWLQGGVRGWNVLLRRCPLWRIAVAWSFAVESDYCVIFALLYKEPETRETGKMNHHLHGISEIHGFRIEV